jgi:hypothetical protein
MASMRLSMMSGVRGGVVPSVPESANSPQRSKKLRYVEKSVTAKHFRRVPGAHILLPAFDK